MTTAAGDGRRHNVVKRALSHLSHFAVKVLIVYIAINAAVWLMPADNPWGFVLATVSLALLFGMVAGRVLHDSMWPCDYCVARFPLDAPAEAEKKMFWLRLNHDRRLSITWAVLLLWSVVGAFLVGPIYGLQWPRFPSAVATILPQMIVLTAFTRAQIVHQKLQPWCPICQRRDGWGKNSTTAPVPTPPQAKVDV